MERDQGVILIFRDFVMYPLTCFDFTENAFVYLKIFGILTL